MLQLFEAPRQSLKQSEANKFKSMGKKENLDLNAATARHIRQQLAEEGFLRIDPDGRYEKYTLTSTGQQQLGAIDLFPLLQVKGEIVNQLLEFARQAAKQFEPTATVTMETKPAAQPANLTEVVLEEFADLRREKYQSAGMVPIYEIRNRVRAKFGEEAARHDVLDEVIKSLWRSGHMRMAALSDTGRATSDQLNDSIPGRGETLFYLEDAHEPAIL